MGFTFFKGNDKRPLWHTFGKILPNRNGMDAILYVYETRDSIDEDRWNKMITKQDQLLINRMDKKGMRINKDVIFHTILREKENEFTLRSEIIL